MTTTTKMTMVVMMVMAAVVADVRGAFNEPTWGFQSYLQENFTLQCNHSDLIVTPHNHVEWILPNGDRVPRTSKKHVLSDGMRGTVTHMNLLINNVQDSDAGVYVCYVYTNIRKEALRGHLLRGLNLGGPMYREPFEEYRDNLMVGGLAAVVLFVPLVTACFVYKFRFQTKEQKAEKRAARLEATKHRRHLENNGKGQQLSEISVTNGAGESNAAFTEEKDDTRL
ncbi:uncharacterized protein LOC143298814 isoform X2 [Babylonia areolata]